MPNIFCKSCGADTARFLMYVCPFLTLCIKGFNFILGSATFTILNKFSWYRTVEVNLVDTDDIITTASNINKSCAHEDWRTESPRTYNQFHSILRHFDVLPNFPFTTSETMGDWQLLLVNMVYASCLTSCQTT